MRLLLSLLPWRRDRETIRRRESTILSIRRFEAMRSQIRIGGRRPQASKPSSARCPGPAKKRWPSLSASRTLTLGPSTRLPKTLVCPNSTSRYGGPTLENRNGHWCWTPEETLRWHSRSTPEAEDGDHGPADRDWLGYVEGLRRTGER